MADKFSSPPDEGDEVPDDESGDLADELFSADEPAADESAVTDPAPEASTEPEPEQPAEQTPTEPAEQADAEPDFDQLVGDQPADETATPEEPAEEEPAPEEPAAAQEEEPTPSAPVAAAKSARPKKKAPKAEPVEAEAADAEADQADQAEGDEASEDEDAAPRPVHRTLTQAPVKKDRPTAKQSGTGKPAPKHTSPAAFTRQSLGELRKVVWPNGDATGQYFVVVLIFVLVIMGIVFGLDQLFGWALLKWLGGS